MKRHLPLILILILGTALRFWHNTDISLWHDEAFSALLIKYSWSEMMYRIGLDVHPPMYYIFLRFWHYIFGDSLLALRGLTIFFGASTIWAGYAFVKTAFMDKKSALWAALLIALNPFQIQYATEARMYTMGAFFAVLAAYFLVKALHYQSAVYEEAKDNMPNMPAELKDKKMMLWNYAGFTISIIILIYTHYYLFFTAAAICLYGLLYLIYHHRGNFFKKLSWLLLSFIGIVISYLPWLKTFMYQYSQVQEGYWIPKMDFWSIPTTLWQLVAGFGLDGSKLWVREAIVNFGQFSLPIWPANGTIAGVEIVTIVTFAILVWFLKRTQFFEKWLVLLAVLAPFGGAILFLILAKLKGSDSSVYLVRYFLYTSAFLSVVFAVWFSQIKTKAVGKILLGAYLILNLAAFHSFWKDLNITQRPGMAAASKFLKANVEPEHKIYVGTSFMFFNYKYYNQTPVRPLLYTNGTSEANKISHFAGSAILTDQDLLPNFSQEVKNGDTVWLIWTNGFGSSKPEVPRNWTQIDEEAYPEVRPYVGTNVYVSQFKVN